MPRRTAVQNPDFSRQMADAFLLNDQMNQTLLKHLDPRAWRAKLPGEKGRTIADIFSHVHNMRRKWLRLSLPQVKVPAELDRRKCTPKQAGEALAESALRCSKMLESMIPDADGTKFLRDGWARPWRPGATMFAYMIAHDAHHRGQVCMLAHQLGYQLPVLAGAGMWAWERLAKECGFLLDPPRAKSR